MTRQTKILYIYRYLYIYIKRITSVKIKNYTQLGAGMPILNQAVAGRLLPALQPTVHGVSGAGSLFARWHCRPPLSESTVAEMNQSKNPATPVVEVLPLTALFPRCFNWEQPQPLKLKIHQDLMNLGYDKALVKRSLRRYCLRPRYRYRVRAGAMRVDLDGQPAGMVTEEEADQMRHARQQQAKRQASAQAALPVPETPLPEDHLVSGRLELNVKFSDLPKPLAVQGGLKIGIQTGEGIVTVVLPSKMWKKLEQAAAHYPAWIAALSGSLERFENGEIVLKNPAVQVFEKKANPTMAPDAIATEVSTSSVPAPATTPITATVGRATLSLKSKS